uniref:CCR4-NOT transcription complex subunit 1 CAF1-binding domain-containing protein n=1 Tax=Micrurus lemniscatus lemniscatus TaxID=129467 RepID=A0A2D4HM53_MICLE
MAIMNVLAELHQEHDLKLNLKFEIEVLCKNLALDINDLKPGSLLKDKDRLKTLDEQLSAPKKDIKQAEELPPITTTTTSTTSATSTTCTATVPPQPQYSYHDINVYSLGGLAPHITLNPTVSISSPVGKLGWVLLVCIGVKIRQDGL